jgi:hypothetical protein
MSDECPQPRAFYTERIPAQFNRALDEQEAQGPAGRRVYEAMRAVTATIRVDVTGEGGGTFFLDIERGRMSATTDPAQPPLVTLQQDRRAFERIAAEAGDSALGLLGGLAGLAGEIRLTRSRVEDLAEVKGLLHFEVTGEQGFVLRSHFGSDPVPAVPDTTVRIDEAAYRDLRSGSLDPQSAFMDHRIVVQGDMQIAMQLALAAVAGD